MSKSPSLRRIQADIRELALDPSDRYQAAPMENDMFEWHFTIRGADGTDFEGGMYHGRILLPPDYPYKPPHIMFLTPSGRFEINTKICLSFSAYHPELWQPAWGIRLILEALISFLPTPADGAIGALDWSATERKTLATKSKEWTCPCCGKIAGLLPELVLTTTSNNKHQESKPSRFQKEIEQLQLLQQQEHQKKDPDGKDADDALSDPGRTNKESDRVDESSAPKEKQDDAVEGTESHEDPKVKDDETSDDTADVPTSEQLQADATHPVADQVARSNTDDGSWVMDPLLQAVIVILSIICFLLFRKVQALWEDLQTLE